ncbi:MAG: hypothetical protein AAGA75_17925 [Cyanobacteria bacterium P01_E01_bin.6]
MLVTSQLKEVGRWLDDIGSRTIHVGVDGGTEAITKERLLELTSRCEWAELRDDSRLPGVFHKHLVIGYGDFLEWCRSGGESDSAKAYFLTAS